MLCVGRAGQALLPRCRRTGGLAACCAGRAAAERAGCRAASIDAHTASTDAHTASIGARTQHSPQPHHHNPREFEDAIIRRFLDLPAGRQSVSLQPRFANVSIVGAANVGKSTLMNLLIQNKVSAVSPKANTTRQRALGVYSKGLTQLAFFDTPGIVQLSEAHRFKKVMVMDAWNAISESDMVLLLLDATRKLNAIEERVLQELAVQARDYSNVQTAVVLNKVDLVSPKTKLLPLAELVNQKFSFDRTFMVSALQDDGVVDIKKYLIRNAKPGRWPYSNDVVTDMTLIERVSEVIREKFFMRLNQELPYGISLKNDTFARIPGRRAYAVNMSVYVPNKRHLAMIIGSEGKVLDFVRKAASQELECLLGSPVELGFDVLVKKSPSIGTISQ